MTTRAQHEKERKKDEFPNSGLLSRNDKKDPNNPEHKRYADYKGKCDIGGVPYWINGYIKESVHGKFLSLQFRHRDPRPDAETH
jgi:hypothetical protein